MILAGSMTIFLQLGELILSIEFGSLLITGGAIIYSPTGNKFGKYAIVIGFCIFALNALYRI